MDGCLLSPKNAGRHAFTFLNHIQRQADEPEKIKMADQLKLKTRNLIKSYKWLSIKGKEVRLRINFSCHWINANLVSWQQTANHSLPKKHKVVHSTNYHINWWKLHHCLTQTTTNTSTKICVVKLNLTKPH